MIRIEVVTCARSGFVLAIDTERKPGTAAVVGLVYRVSLDGEPEAWKAWLWPAPGVYPPTGQSTEAVTRKGKPDVLREVLRKRHQAHGEWWTA